MKTSLEVFINLMIEFIKRPRQVAALCPETQKCVQTFLRYIDFASIRSIVEWGPGTGMLTRYILRHKRENTLYIGIETNPRFFATLQFYSHKFPNTFFYHDDILKTSLYLSQHELEKADIIVSTIPLSFLEYKRIIQLAARIGEKYLQYIYILTLLRGFWPASIFQENFYNVEIDFCVYNCPPFFLFVASSSKFTPHAPAGMRAQLF